MNLVSFKNVQTNKILSNLFFIYITLITSYTAAKKLVLKIITELFLLKTSTLLTTPHIQIRNKYSQILAFMPFSYLNKLKWNLIIQYNPTTPLLLVWTYSTCPWVHVAMWWTDVPSRVHSHPVPWSSVTLTRMTYFTEATCVRFLKTSIAVRSSPRSLTHHHTFAVWLCQSLDSSNLDVLIEHFMESNVWFRKHHRS